MLRAPVKPSVPQAAGPLAGLLLVLLIAMPAMAQDDETEPCGPNNVDALAREDGVLLTWDPEENATSYVITRTNGDETVHNVGPNETSFLDTDVEAGVTYTYELQAFVDQAPSLPGGTTLMDSCGEVAATAIPVFPTVATAVLGSLAAVGAYIGLRRR